MGRWGKFRARSSCLAIFLGCLIATSVAQNPGEFKTQVNLISLDVSATEKDKGKILEFLLKDDFEVTDNGKPVPFTATARDGFVSIKVGPTRISWVDDFRISAIIEL